MVEERILEHDDKFDDKFAVSKSVKDRDMTRINALRSIETIMDKCSFKYSKNVASPDSLAAVCMESSYVKGEYKYC